MSVYVVGHKSPDTDSVAAAIAYAALMKAKGEDYVPAVSGKLNPESEVVLKQFGFPTPETLTDATGKEMPLADHADRTQAPGDGSAGGARAAPDHHKIGDVTTNQPIFFCNMPVGCSCTVLKILYDLEGVKVDPKVAGIMLSAILSDTVNFKSPTCTEADKKAVKELAAIAGVKDTDAIFMEMLKAKSAVAGVPPMDLLHRDYKDFDMKGKKVGVGQLELATLDQVADMRDALLAAMKEQKGSERHSVLLMLTDVVKEGTDLMVLSDDPALIESAFGKKLQGNSMWIDGMMSRKKQTVPNLQKAFGC